jgi:hypothetical protein
MSTRQANTDQWARELYTRFHLCGACQGAVTLAEQLGGRCPHCAAQIFAGPFTPDRARERLAELKARRRVLGLSNTS